MRLSLGHAPGTALKVPTSLAAELRDAVAAGQDEAAGWARIHPSGSTTRFDRDTLGSIATPPTGEQQRAELEELHAIAAARSAQGTERAMQLDRRAGWETWEATIDLIGRTHGADQARRAAELVRVAAARVDKVSGDAKRQFDRPRPFQLDPSLTTAVSRPHGNASHPSGHASGAYAAAIVLASFVPERADELLDLAAEVAFSRLYGGVHFRSDVVVGARIAARITADVLRRDAQRTVAA